MDRIPNARIRDLCGMTNGVDERINESVLRWFGHIERIGSDRIPKTLYVGDYRGNSLVGRPRKR